MTLEVGDMVLVHVTTFKGHHKFQDRWEIKEHVVEKWPCPNVPVYVVCPRDMEGCSWTLHGNYLLPINSNMEQGKTDKPMARVGNITSLTPVPPVDNACLLMQDHLGQPHHVQQVAHPRVVQIDLPHLDVAPEPPRTDFHVGTWNFGLLADAGLAGIWDA